MPIRPQKLQPGAEVSPSRPAVQDARSNPVLPEPESREVYLGDYVGATVDVRRDDDDALDLSGLSVLERIRLRQSGRRNGLGQVATQDDSCSHLSLHAGGVCVKLGQMPCPFLGGYQRKCPFIHHKNADLPNGLMLGQYLASGMTAPSKEELDGFTIAVEDHLAATLEDYSEDDD